MRVCAGAFMLMMLGTAASQAAVQHKVIEYKDGAITCKGYLAWDDATDVKRPGVLLVHEWWGLNDYARERANQLASLGYLAFACDMYGEGKTVDHPRDAGTMAGIVRANVDSWRKRAVAGLDVLKSQALCDTSKLAAIGYCFGGSTALQLAYSGADLDAVVTFHAALPTPTADDAKKIKATVQVHNGALDTFIPDDAIKAFTQALDTAGADWSFTNHGGAVHSFTVKTIDAKNVPGLKYNQHADERSWKSMLDLFEEKLGPRPGSR